MPAASSEACGEKAATTEIRQSEDLPTAFDLKLREGEASVVAPDLVVRGVSSFIPTHSIGIGAVGALTAAPGSSSRRRKVAVRMDAIFDSLGFQIDHVGGVSRAWLLTLPRREFVVISDPGGYDLPLPAGPYSAFHYSGTWTPDDEPTLLDDAQQLILWLLKTLPQHSPQIALLHRIHPFTVR